MSQVGEPKEKITSAPVNDPVPPKPTSVPESVPEKVPAKDA